MYIHILKSKKNVGTPGGGSTLSNQTNWVRSRSGINEICKWSLTAQFAVNDESALWTECVWASFQDDSNSKLLLLLIRTSVTDEATVRIVSILKTPLRCWIRGVGQPIKREGRLLSACSLNTTMLCGGMFHHRWWSVHPNIKSGCVIGCHFERCALLHKVFLSTGNKG